MYYGGEPPTWTKVPDLPDDAKYQAMAAPSTGSGAASLPVWCHAAWQPVAVAAMVAFAMSLQWFVLEAVKSFQPGLV